MGNVRHREKMRLPFECCGNLAYSLRFVWLALEMENLQLSEWGASDVEFEQPPVAAGNL